MAKRNVVLSALQPDLGWPSYQQVMVDRWQGNQHTHLLDNVAEEVPVALVYNGSPHVVMLATPTNLEDFAFGFSVTEGIVERAADILSIHTYNHANGIEIRIEIPESKFCNMPDKARNLAGRTGCGLCGASTLEQAIKETRIVTDQLQLGSNDLMRALNELNEFQTINKLTGAVHAAAWVVPGQALQFVREDVGRHNALDKLIGLLLRLGKNPAEGFILMTSRASYEVVQKAASVGVNLLAAISAPTALAVRLADEAGMTLIGFVRELQYVIYSHPNRLTHTPYPTLIKS